jgi:O-antigen/teichoic acid export membrane protein
LLKNKLLIRFFSSGLQSVGVQVLGSVFFYIISIYLTKDNFGLISWMNAISMFITALLGLGLEQVVIRRIAASDRSDWAAGAFLTHSIISFITAFSILVIIDYNTDITNITTFYLPWFFIAQGLIFIGVPLKQYLNAKERFTPYGIIAIISNSVKIIAAFWLQHTDRLDTITVIYVLVLSALFELCCLLVYILTKTNFSFKFRFKAYIKLIKESSAQYISVIFDMSLSRMDWILLGMLTTNVILADYSFAYRAFELARLPLLIIAPMILPRLSRIMALNNKPNAAQQKQINAFNTLEMCLAMLLPLVLNVLWAPVVALITHSKYGYTNSVQFMVLSFCIPLQFFINLLWSISFAAKKYKVLTMATICCAVSNVILNLVLIPKYGGLGSAIAFFSTTLLQCALYYQFVYRRILVLSLKPAITFIIIAVGVYLMVIHLTVHFAIQLLIAVFAYMLFAILSKQITKDHIQDFKRLLA